MQAQNGATKGRNGVLEGLLAIGCRFVITLMRSWIRIRGRVKIPIQIHIEVKTHHIDVGLHYCLGLDLCFRTVTNTTTEAVNNGQRVR